MWDSNPWPRERDAIFPPAHRVDIIRAPTGNLTVRESSKEMILVPGFI